MLSSILLAAGESKRMGRFKQLMPWGQSTMIEQTLDNLLSSEVDEVIVVVGHKAEEVKKVLSDKSVRIVINPNYKQGMSTSVIAGLNQVDSQAKAVLLAFGDQPLIDYQTINTLIGVFRSNNKGIAIPTYQGSRGHPVIFDLKYRQKLQELKGDIGGRQIISNHSEDVLEVAVNCEGVCIDYDVAYSSS